jgi:hypothetical protein
MEEERGMIIHLTDGSKMHFSFPRQVKSDDSVSVRLQMMLEKTVLLVETDGALLAFPFSSIKYLQVYPSPAKLPDYIIKGATLVT